jgi:dihydrofolate reductase
VNYWDEQMAQVMNEAVSAPFDLVLGRRTYDIFAAHWPHATEEDGARPFNAPSSTSLRGVIRGWSGATRS